MFHQQSRPEPIWPVIRSSKAHIAAGIATGLIIGLYGNYIAAGILALWLLAGGQ
jgi:hypothetical protein